MSARGVRRWARGGAALAIVVAALAAFTPRAQADDPAGALSAHLLIADGDLGGSALLDLWVPVDWFRIGGVFGVGVIPAERDAHNRIYMPIGISAAAEFAFDGPIGLSVRARAGAWGGATQAEKLTAGFFVNGGAWLTFDFGIGVLLGAGVDLTGLIASDAWRQSTSPDDVPSASVLIVSPGLTFTWTPRFGE